MFARESGMSDYTSSSKALSASVTTIVNLPFITVFLALEEGRVVGGIVLAVLPYMWDPSKTLADEVFSWCHTDTNPHAEIKLLQETERFAREHAQIISMHAHSGSPSTVGAVYQRMGMKPAQVSFMGTP